MPEVINKDTDATEDPAHVAAALKKADSGLDPNAGAATLLAGKYKTEADLHKGLLNILPKAGGIDLAVELYKALESRIGTPAESRGAFKVPDVKPAAVTPPVEPSTETPGSEPSQPAGEKPAPIDYQALGQEFAEKGALSPETYTALAAQGLPKSMVDTYLTGVKATQAGLHEAAGGQEAYQTMLAWGAETFNDAERNAYDKAITEGSAEERTAAVAFLKARYTQAKGPLVGVRPNTADGGGSPMGIRPFESHRQLIVAQQDPRYGKDPAYEKEILARLAISRF